MNYSYPNKVDDFLEECIEALEKEKQHVGYQLYKEGLDEQREIQYASFETQDSRYYYYSLRLENSIEGTIPVGFPCELRHGKSVCRGNVERMKDERTLMIGVEDDLGDELTRGILDFDFTYLTQALISFLEEIGDSHETDRKRKLQTLIEGGPDDLNNPGKVNGIPEDVNQQQRKAITYGIDRSYQMVWGPPGTGKTRTVADMALTLHQKMDPDQQILITSHTNVAVDNAMQKIFDRLDSSSYDLHRDDLSMIRYGQVNDQLYREGISLDHHFNQQAKKHTEFLELLNEVEHLLRNSELEPEFNSSKSDSIRTRISEIRSCLEFVDLDSHDSELKEKYRRLLAREQKIEKKCLKSARIVGTTIAQLFMNSFFFDFSFDIGLVDEISMMGLPLSIAPRWLVDDFVCFGDAKQLPPVVQSDNLLARNYLGKNLFQFQEIEDPEDDRVIMLQKQYRMPESVCSIISDLFYDGELNTEKQTNGNSHESNVRHPLFWLDTQNLSPQTERPGDRSLKNDVHANVTASIAKQLHRQQVDNIGIVTPYRAQVQEIRRAWRQFNDEKDTEQIQNPGIEVNTVHSYQGREKDIIIFDTVISPPKKSYFMDDRSNREVENIVNVAASRTSTSLIVIANEEELNEQLSSESVLPKLVNLTKTFSKMGKGDGFTANGEESVQEIARKASARLIGNLS